MEIAYLSSFHDLSFSISDTVYLLRLELKYIGDKHCIVSRINSEQQKKLITANVLTRKIIRGEDPNIFVSNTSASEICRIWKCHEI